MVNVIGADAGISFMNAKYHYLFWRPVTAIDPTSVSPDGYGAVPGPDDGNPATVEQPGWRPLLATRTIPSTPPRTGRWQVRWARCSSPPSAPSRSMSTSTASTPTVPREPERGAPLRNRRRFAGRGRQRSVWAGLHYRFSVVAGNTLGAKVADYDLQHAFQPVQLAATPATNVSQSGRATSAPD